MSPRNVVGTASMNRATRKTKRGNSRATNATYSTSGTCHPISVASPNANTIVNHKWDNQWVNRLSVDWVLCLAAGSIPSRHQPQRVRCFRGNWPRSCLPPNAVSGSSSMDSGADPPSRVRAQRVSLRSPASPPSGPLQDSRNSASGFPPLLPSGTLSPRAS